jgi:hypothetical protein
MIPIADLRSISKARLRDAAVLLRSTRYDGAVYLCGYVVEIALKARICRTLGWMGYPSTKGEFQNLQTFKTHDLDILLRLSGVETKIKAKYLAEWSAVAAWDPEVRYKQIGTATRQDSLMMMDSARILLRVL